MSGVSKMVLGMLTLSLAAGAAPSAAQPGPAAGAAADQAEEIVVTARRSGIPVWKVKGPRTSVILVGDLEGVAKGTRWDPAALGAALKKADRVMYPSDVSVSLSRAEAIKALGYYLRWRRQQTLPKGQSLGTMMTPAHYQRLVTLRKKGVLKAGFERRHPFHLAQQLKKHSAKQIGRGPSDVAFVRSEVKKLKIETMPLQSINGIAVARQLVETSPAAYVPCLLDVVTSVEGGAEGMRARSQAWASRRVPDVLASPAGAASETCEPEAVGIRARPDLRPQIRRLLSDPRVTLAVLNVELLAKPGGVLDDLVAAGFDISGPAWKR